MSLRILNRVMAKWSLAKGPCMRGDPDISFGPFIISEILDEIVGFNCVLGSGRTSACK
jgi:hypothetical protein